VRRETFLQAGKYTTATFSQVFQSIISQAEKKTSVIGAKNILVLLQQSKVK